MYAFKIRDKNRFVLFYILTSPADLMQGDWVVDGILSQGQNKSWMLFYHCTAVNNTCAVPIRATGMTRSQIGLESPHFHWCHVRSKASIMNPVWVRRCAILLARKMIGYVNYWERLLKGGIREWEEWDENGWSERPFCASEVGWMN